MSKIGKAPITIPQGAAIKIEGSQVTVSGPKGELKLRLRPEINVTVDGEQLKVARDNESKISKSLHGLTRSLIANMMKGVTEGHEKTLEIIGVGYRATKQGENLLLNIGYSHPVTIEPSVGIQLDTKENKIIVTGIDKALVGETAAKIRRVRPPEPYKGKGIKYLGEIIRRKAGKAAKTAQA